MIELPCSDSTLPKKADFVNLFNQIAEIPTDLEMQINEYRAQIESKINQAEKNLKGLSIEEIEKGIDKEIGKLELQAIEEIEEKIEELEDIMEGIADLLSPYWKKGQIRDWEKEAEDAIDELIQEFHIFIPVKMMEMISKIIPVEFNVNVLGIDIDVLKVFTEEEQNRIRQQIEDDIDKFYNMVESEYQYYKSEFGLLCDEYKAKLTWQYIKSEIMDWVTNSLFKLFDALIGKFKEIWDALGLPDLPIPLSFDVASWIRAQVDAAKEKMDREIQRIEDQAEQLQEDIENFDAQKEIEKVKQQMVDEVMGLSIPLPSPFDISLKEIMGGDIDKTVISIEEEIDKLVTAARDWTTITMKELLNIWIKKIKKFLDAIGLGKLLDLLTLTFCDVLELLGVPTSFDVTLPELPQIDVQVPV